MVFQWDTPPDVWVDGIENYTVDTFAELFAVCAKHAQIMQNYLRANAPWEDENDPERTYLKAEAYYPDRWSVGIRVWYDLEGYRQKLADPKKESYRQAGGESFDWATRHETVTFAKKGVIAIIMPRGETEGQGQMTALGSLADDLWDEVRALYGGASV